MSSGIKTIEWSPELAVGFASVDVEHMTLVVLYNDCATAIQRRASPDLVCRLIRQVEETFIRHFRNEERLLRFYGYPETEEHAERHRAAEEQLRAIVSGAGSPSSLVAVLLLLRNWILEHILVEDRQVFACLPRPRAVAEG